VAAMSCQALFGNSRNEGNTMCRMTFQASPVRSCPVTQETRVYNVEDDVAGIVCQGPVT